MKTLTFTFFAAALIFASCNSADQAEKARQDSIQAAAAADSILNAAMEADTLATDSLAADSAQ